jgi:hypothetical protein
MEKPVFVSSVYGHITARKKMNNIVSLNKKILRGSLRNQLKNLEQQDVHI